MRLSVFLAAILSLASVQAARALVPIASVDAHLQLVTKDGRVLRLAGVQPIVLPQVRGVLDQHRLIERSSTEPETPIFDRWGAEYIAPKGEGGLTLQSILVRDGLALIRPDTAFDDQVERLRPLERAARDAGRGFWQASVTWPLAADDAASHEGQYALVRGQVLQAQAARRYTYLNFGAVWRTDFTVRVPNTVAKTLAKQGLDLLALEGRWIEARGFVFDENGPMIEIRHRDALEIVK